MVLEDEVQAAGGEKSLMVLPNCEPWMLQYQPDKKVVPISAIVAWLLWEYHFPIIFEV